MTTSLPSTSESRDCMCIGAFLDVKETDEYLVSLLSSRGAALGKHLFVSPTHRRWWDSFLTAMLHGATMWGSEGQTPATQALGLKVRQQETSPTDIGRTGNGRLPRRGTLVWWILLSAVLPRLYQELELWLLQQEIQSTNSNHHYLSQPGGTMDQVARQRKRQLVRYVVEWTRRTIPVLRLCSLLSSWTSLSRTPCLAMQLMGIAYHNERPPQHLFVTFAHRRWLYEELVKTLQMLSPAASLPSLSQLYIRILRPLKEIMRRIGPASNRLTQTGKCPLCGTDAISVPYVTNCNHIYCYVCLWDSHLQARQNNNPRCRICHAVITSCQRWNGGE